MQDLNMTDMHFLIDIGRLTGFTDMSLTNVVCAWCDVPHNWLRTRRYVLDRRIFYTSSNRQDKIVDILNTDGTILGRRIAFDGYEASAAANVSVLCKV